MIIAITHKVKSNSISEVNASIFALTTTIVIVIYLLLINNDNAYYKCKYMFIIITILLFLPQLYYNYL
jgi:uncharacterized membrane protein